jgi:hypothetical protein
MSRLNPIGELLDPIVRLETAVADLSEEISPVAALPRIEADLHESHAAIVSMLEALTAMQADLRRVTDAVERLSPSRNGSGPGFGGG